MCSSLIRILGNLWIFQTFQILREINFLTIFFCRSADAELQQRACEYLALSKVATLDVLATVLEEMPPFPEKESCGLLNLLKKKRPGKTKLSSNIWALK